MARTANFLKTSKNAQAHIDVMHAILRNRVRFDGTNWIMTDADGVWLANISYNIRMLATRGLILLVPQSMMYSMGSKAALVSATGTEALKAVNALHAGKHLFTEYTWDGMAGHTYMARYEELGHARYVIYCDGVEHSRYRTAAAMWQVFHVLAPRTPNTEEIGR